MKNVFRMGLCLVLVVGAGCAGRHRPKQGLGEVERLPRLETVNPRFHSDKNKLVDEKSYTLTVEALEKAELNARVRGYVKNLKPDIDIGRTIVPGETLLELDIPDIRAERDSKKAMLEQSRNLLAQAMQAIVVAGAEVAESEAQVPRYEAEHKFRELEHKRISELAMRDTVARQRAEETELQAKSARAAWSASQAQVATKRARWEAAKKEKEVVEARVNLAEADLARLEIQIGFATIKAPFKGVITKRWVSPGDTVKEGSTPLLTVMRTDEMRVIIDVPERDAPFIRAGKDGNRVKLRIPALDQQKNWPQDLDATITRSAAALDPVTRTMRTEVHLKNEHGLLKPQMTGTATIVLAERKAYTVPSSALVRAPNRIEIYVVDIADPKAEPARGVVRARRVVLGVDDGQRVEIRKIVIGDREPQDPRGDEMVIVRGAGVIRPGEEVIAVLNKSE